MRLIDADKLKEKLEPKPRDYYPNIHDCFGLDGYIALEAVMKAIDDAQTVDEWFPVNEKLPDEEGLYLVTAIYGERKVITIGAYYISGNWDLEKKDKNLTVACWCKLPEGESNDIQK